MTKQRKENMKDDIKSTVEQAKYFFQTQNFHRAEDLFKKVIAGKKEFADVYNYLGLISHEKGQYDEAIQYFEKALSKNPRYTEALLNLSILYNDMGEYNKAKKLVERSRKDSKKTPTAIDPFIRSKLANKHAEVGDWYRGVGAFDQAIEEYRKALGLESKYTDIRTKMSVCLRELGKNREALEELKKAIKDNVKFADAHVQLGVTYYTLGKKVDALKTWKAAKKRFPKHKALGMYLRFTS